MAPPQRMPAMQQRRLLNSRRSNYEEVRKNARWGTQQILLKNADMRS
jgi:hypothetical protein